MGSTHHRDESTASSTRDDQDLIDASDSPTECAHHIPKRNFEFLPLIPVSSSQRPPRRPIGAHHQEHHHQEHHHQNYHRLDEGPGAHISAAEPWYIPITKSVLPEELQKQIQATPKSGRSDSMSSSESFGRQRYLKLNPVYDGGEPGEPDFTLVD